MHKSPKISSVFAIKVTRVELNMQDTVEVWFWYVQFLGKFQIQNLPLTKQKSEMRTAHPMSGQNQLICRESSVQPLACYKPLLTNQPLNFSVVNQRERQLQWRPLDYYARLTLWLFIPPPPLLHRRLLSGVWARTPDCWTERIDLVLRMRGNKWLLLRLPWPLPTHWPHRSHKWIGDL